MKQVLITLTLLATLPLAFAQEKLSRDEALGYARAVSSDAKQLNATPIATDVDAEQPVAMKDGEYGCMVLPQKGLTAEAIAKAGEAAVPLGQLWLHKLTPMRHGEAVAQDDLRLVTVRAEGDEVKVPQCALAVRRNSSGALELLVFGKGKQPLLSAPLKAMNAQQARPLDLEAVNNGASGELTFKILGKHQATISVTELERY